MFTFALRYYYITEKIMFRVMTPLFWRSDIETDVGLPVYDKHKIMIMIVFLTTGLERFGNPSFNML